MPPPRGRTQKAPIVDISDSSSRASEDNVAPTEPKLKKNPVILHYAAENPDKPDAKMNGPYGMFSQCSPLSPTARAKTLTKRKRATINRKVSSSSKRRIASETRADNKISETNGISRKEREESSLFEPVNGWQEDGDADVEMLNPPSTPASSARTQSLKGTEHITATTRGNRSKRPIVFGSGSECSDSDSDSDAGSNIVVSTQSNSTLKISQNLLITSPLPEDISVIDEYIGILNKLASEAAAISAHKRIIVDLAKEEAAISLVIGGLPAEENQHLATIAHTCARGIQADMANPSIATDMSAIQAAIEKCNKEAEISRQSMPGIMAKREEELEARRLDACSKKEAALLEWRTGSGSDIDSLLKVKEDLEREGGMAMAFELGRRME